MAIDINDPRITAYALGELDESERLVFERELEQSSEAGEWLAELRGVAAALRNELASEPLPHTARTPVAEAVRAVMLGTGAAQSNKLGFGVNNGRHDDDAKTAARRLAAGQAEPKQGRPLAGRRALAVLAVAASVMVVAALMMPGVQSARQTSARSSRSLAEAERQLQRTQVARSTRDVDNLEGFDASDPRVASDKPVAGRQSADEPALQTTSPDHDADGVPQDNAGQLYSIFAQPQQQTTEQAASQPGAGVRFQTSSRNRPAPIFRGQIQSTQNAPTVAPITDLNRWSMQARGAVGKEPTLKGGSAASAAPASVDFFYAAANGRGGEARLDEELVRRGVTLEGLRQEHRLRAEQLAEVEHNTEQYSRLYDNPFRTARENPLSTFSIDVDTASYANVRRFLTQSTLPPADAVRIEELLNYFTYHYAPPASEGAAPFSAHTEVTACPWNAKHRLARIGLKGREVAEQARPASNLVFLLDVSGSMQDQNKLPLVKQSIRMLVDKLNENDRVAIVVYAGASGLVLPSTTANNKDTIRAAIDQLEAGGSTNGASGIELAYQTAVANLVKGGTNRVILCTDGDFNVGVTDEGSLTRLIEDRAKTGVFLTVLGFGMGNYKDGTLEKLADKGNGAYGYIDTPAEARKTFVEQLSGTLVTIAKDVKIQIEFNPAVVASYRLLGYENRVLAAEDFNDDKKDAGEIGAGHTVTALYEIVPVGAEPAAPGVDPLKYQKQEAPPAAAASDELLTLKLRYKEPAGETSQLLEFPVKDGGLGFAQASKDTQFAASVALFGMLLRQSEHAGSGNFDSVLEIAGASRDDDPGDYRREFIELVKKAKQLAGNR